MSLRDAIIQLNWIINGEKKFKQNKRDIFLNVIWNEMDIQLDSSNNNNNNNKHLKGKSYTGGCSKVTVGM